MNQVDEAALFTTLDKYMERRFGRLLLRRCFQGIVTQVDLTTLPFGIWIQHEGDSEPDPTRYACSIPSYIPYVGDRVEMFWRSDSVAVVLMPVDAPGDRPFASFLPVNRNSVSLAIPLWANHLEARVNFVATTNPSTFQLLYNSCVAYAWQQVAGQAATPSAANTSPLGAFRCGLYNNALAWPTQMHINLNRLQSALAVRPITSVEDRQDGAGNTIFSALNTGYGTTVEAMTTVIFSCSAGVFAGPTSIDVYLRP